MAFQFARGLSTTLSIAGIALCASGCVGAGSDNAAPPPLVVGNPFYANIDTGETLTTQPGQGAGAFLEYLPGGQWQLFTSCDTQVTGQLCQFQVNVTRVVRAPSDAISGVGLKSSDYFQLYSDGSFSFYATTGNDENGVNFVSQAGTPVAVELVLDGNVDPTYLVWFGNGTVHATPNGNGATSSPVVFQPNSP